MSEAVMTSTSSPNSRAIDAPRLSSSNRSLLVATAIEPRWMNPVACSVSSSSVANRSVVYFAKPVRLRVARS